MKNLLLVPFGLFFFSGILFSLRLVQVWSQKFIFPRLLVAPSPAFAARNRRRKESRPLYGSDLGTTASRYCGGEWRSMHNIIVRSVDEEEKAEEGRGRSYERDRSCDARVSKTGFRFAGQNIYLERKAKELSEVLPLVGLHASVYSVGLRAAGSARIGKKIKKQIGWMALDCFFRY